MDQVKLRAWWAHRQGLDGSLEGRSAAHILEKTGWARSVGGSGPYLTLFARGGISRAAADEAAALVDVHELPAARGCTYVVPSADFALALTAGQGFHDAQMKLARKLGVSDAEVEKLCAAILAALGRGAMDPDGIREAVGPAARSLGDEGKKKGLTTTLPLALGVLQERGEIRRVPVNGRLDQQRYRYTLWKPAPLAKAPMAREEAYTELARRYFSWIGPASMAEWQWFSGLSVKAGKAALEPLKLEPLSKDDPRLMLPGEREDLEKFKVPKEPRYVLTAGLDGIFLLRRDLAGLVDPKDGDVPVPVEKGEKVLGGLSDLEDHAILDRGRLVGVWAYDPQAESIAWISFAGKPAAMKAAVERMEGFVREQLGDVRAFSLDSPKSRVPRIKALRAGAGGAAR